jgi:hypothetical protein
VISAKSVSRICTGICTARRSVPHFERIRYFSSDGLQLPGKKPQLRNFYRRYAFVPEARSSLISFVCRTEGSPPLGPGSTISDQMDQETLTGQLKKTEARVRKGRYHGIWPVRLMRRWSMLCGLLTRRPAIRSARGKSPDNSVYVRGTSLTIVDFHADQEFH